LPSPDRLPSSALVASAALVAIGLVAGGWALGAKVEATRLGDRYVTVKGLVERQVKSDLAIWSIGYRETGDDLTALSTRVESDRKAVMQFLADQRFESSEIELGAVQLTDTQANEYNAARAPHRYILAQSLTVRTARVDQVRAAAQKTLELLQQGVPLTAASGNVVYKFTKLNAIKPDMITEATRNARASADRFAADSGSKVGAIRQANQGVFSILALDQTSANTDMAFDGGADSSVMKTVRVVTSVDYFLER
jgi:hypothetical protein